MENDHRLPENSPYSFDDDVDESYIRPKLRKLDPAQYLSKDSYRKTETCTGILEIRPTTTDDNDFHTGSGFTCTDIRDSQGQQSDVAFECRDAAKMRQSDCSDQAAPSCPGDVPVLNSQEKYNRDKKIDARLEILREPGSSSSATTENNIDQESSKLTGILAVPGRCRRVVYMHSPQMVHLCSNLPRIPLRAVMVHSLIEALGLLKYVTLLCPEQIDKEQLFQFHAADYIEFLEKMNHLEDEEKVDENEAEQYGLTYDCPVQKGVFDCAALVAGATVTAAKSLCEGNCHVAINWFGGWHHAQRDSASGFCYINDIVLGIHELRKKFSRILYVDIDLHHGDGVENAFSATSRVLTVSLHKYAAGFFPGSGCVEDVGCGKGKYYTVNVPLQDGIRDPEFCSVFKRVLSTVNETYKPEVVVCQCGADALAGDPMSSFNLSSIAYVHCVRFLLDWQLPTLLLGGGGYHHANTARCWAALTALSVSRRLPPDVPDHQYFMDYGPDYEMCVPAGHRRDDNSKDYLIKICRKVSENLQKIPSIAPS